MFVAKTNGNSVQFGEENFCLTFNSASVESTFSLDFVSSWVYFGSIFLFQIKRDRVVVGLSHSEDGRSASTKHFGWFECVLLRLISSQSPSSRVTIIELLRDLTTILLRSVQCNLYMALHRTCGSPGRSYGESVFETPRVGLLLNWTKRKVI